MLAYLHFIGPVTFKRNIFQGHELEETELSTWFTDNHLDVEQGKVVVRLFIDSKHLETLTNVTSP